jgi:hypothetical protein
VCHKTSEENNFSEFNKTMRKWQEIDTESTKTRQTNTKHFSSKVIPQDKEGGTTCGYMG